MYCGDQELEAARNRAEELSGTLVAVRTEKAAVESELAAARALLGDRSEGPPAAPAATATEELVTRAGAPAALSVYNKSTEREKLRGLLVELIGER